MRTLIQRAFGLALSAVLLAAGTVALASPARAHQEFQVLVFSKTAGYRHGWSNHETAGPVPVTDPGGSQPLYLVFQGSGAGLFDLDALTFQGPGAGGST